MISFVKMHGLGNDFVIVDASDQDFPDDQERIARMGNRRTGIGFDQMLIMDRSHQPDAALSYRIFNNDGSSAEQCGNGARCVARYFMDHNGNPDRICMDSPGGLLRARRIDQTVIQLDMGEPRFEPQAIPLKVESLQTLYDVALAREPVTFGAVSMGNPHAVIQVSDVNTAPVASVGPALGVHPIFPQGVNVGFMEIRNRQEMNLRVFERGAGETRACGTGACAAMAVARRLDLVDNETCVKLPGGPLTITWSGENASLFMAGPAEYVFEGKIDL